MRIKNSERGFTIVEVIVAAVIITIVVAGMVYFMGSAGRSQQRASIRQQMSAAADDVMQKVRSDRKWVSDTCARAVCTVTGFDYVPKSSSEPQFTTKVVVEPYDSPADGLGAMDKDGQIPDFYNITVTISLSAAEEAKWGKQEAFSLKSTFDANTIGAGALGSLTVEVCEVTNQVDERMAIEGCLSGEQKLQMRAQPEPCDLLLRNGVEKKSAKEINDDYSSQRYFGLNCNKALEQAARVDDRNTVKVVPGSASFTITPGWGSGGVGVWNNAMADNFSDKTRSVGSYTFSNMPAGTYDLAVNVPAGKEVWKTKSIPQNDKVTVEANKKARALIVVRPKQDTGSYEVRFKRTVYRYVLRSWKNSSQSTPHPAIAPNDPTITPTQVTTEYTYVRAFLEDTPVWNGVSFSGFIAIEPKPFDRYHAPGSGRTQQHVKELTWEPWNASPNDERAKFVFNKDTNFALPTGLHSIPEQLEALEEGIDGTFGERSLKCEGGNCRPTDEYVWIDTNGKANSSVEFHDKETGECYIRSEVPMVPMGWTLIDGGEQPNSGNGKDRCQRDMYINNTLVKDFMPDRNGNGGKTVVFQKQQTVRCNGSPPLTGTCSPSTGMLSSVRPDNNTISDNGSEKKPSFSLDTNSTIQCSAQGQLVAGMTGVPCTGLAAVTGGFYGPAVGAPPALALPTAPCLVRCGGGSAGP